MKVIFAVFLISCLLILSSFENDKPAYGIYNAKGKKVGYGHMINDLAETDIILFGELHNNPIAHWLELNVEKDLYHKKKTLVLGAEMFEADGQLIINEYLKGLIQTSGFEKEARLWNNYSTDYKPLLEFAKEKDLQFIATNIPRRYAAIVSRRGFGGLDSLSAEAWKFMAPLPVDYDPDLPGYRDMRSMMDAHSQPGMSFNPEYFSQAQAIKDATMAFFILKNYRKGDCFLHFNGAYHSNNHEGIVWYLKHARPDLKIKTINVVEQGDTGEPAEENLNSADFIVVVPSDMTKTY